jgi:hypothetical protein
MKERGYHVRQTTPVVHCKLFEDNTGALCLAKAPAKRPWTNHINVKYHHFQAAVMAGLVMILNIHTDDQLEDMLTKADPVDVLQKHRLKLM